MKGKILILLVMFVFLFASGCTEKDAAVPDDSNTSIPKAGEAVQQEENESSESGDHIVRLQNYGVVTPPELDISRGDTISWWSDKRQGNYVLVSEDGLFPDEKLSYRVPFMYTFNETGTYRFIVKNIPEMNATIRVN
jgi:plastocyanin